MTITLTKHVNGRDVWDIPAVIAEARRTARKHENTYGAIVRLCGERNADRIMRTLEVADWKRQDWSNPNG